MELLLTIIIHAGHKDSETIRHEFKTRGGSWNRMQSDLVARILSVGVILTSTELAKK